MVHIHQASVRELYKLYYISLWSLKIKLNTSKLVYLCYDPVTTMTLAVATGTLLTTMIGSVTTGIYSMTRTSQTSTNQFSSEPLDLLFAIIKTKIVSLR